MQFISHVPRLRKRLASVFLMLVLLGSLFVPYDTWHIARAAESNAAKTMNSRMTGSSEGITLKKIKAGRWSAYRNGSIDTSYSGIVKNGKAEVIGMNFIQPDSPWSNVSYAGKKLSTSGCGILAMTNAVYNLTGVFLDPLDVANWAYNNKYFNADSNGGIKNRDCFKKVADQFGSVGQFRYAGYGKNVSSASLRNHLMDGNTAILHVNYHFIAVIGYDDVTEKYLILDSYPGAGTSMPSVYRSTTRYGDWVSLEDLQNKYLKVTEYWLYTSY